ncbi:hypothetical protein J3E69DRAFT_299599 [Trichoderma sp. SZMC 28015]
MLFVGPWNMENGVISGSPRPRDLELSAGVGAEDATSPGGRVTCCRERPGTGQARRGPYRRGEARAWIKRCGRGTRRRGKANFRSASQPGQRRRDRTEQTRHSPPGENKDTACLGVGWGFVGRRRTEREEKEKEKKAAARRKCRGVKSSSKGVSGEMKTKRGRAKPALDSGNRLSAQIVWWTRRCCICTGEVDSKEKREVRGGERGERSAVEGKKKRAALHRGQRRNEEIRDGGEEKMQVGGKRKKKLDMY